MVLYKRTNTPRSLGHTALGSALPDQVWLMLRYPSVHFISLYQARRFQMLHLSHSQDASRAVQWPLQLKCKDLWSIRPCKLHCIRRDVSLGLMHSFMFVSEWIVGASERKSLQDHPWYCFYQLQALLYMVSLCVRGRTEWPDSCIQTSIISIYGFL